MLLLLILLLASTTGSHTPGRARAANLPDLSAPRPLPVPKLRAWHTIQQSITFAGHILPALMEKSGVRQESRDPTEANSSC